MHQSVEKHALGVSETRGALAGADVCVGLEDPEPAQVARHGSARRSRGLTQSMFGSSNFRAWRSTEWRAAFCSSTGNLRVKWIGRKYRSASAPRGTSLYEALEIENHDIQEN